MTTQRTALVLGATGGIGGEMRYLWRTPIRLINDKLVAFLGEEPHTPLDVAVRDTLRGLGCL